VSIPLLRKDFTLLPYQIYQARCIGADGVLLICSILEEEQMKEYIKIADSLGLSCLVEAHNEREVHMALEAGARIIGVNNRNLKTFDVDINTSTRLRAQVPKDILFVSESGIRTNEDIAVLRHNGTNAVLIGEILMPSGNITRELNSLRAK
jgi:indole-3-glycerol phosphate synthase